MKRVIIGLLLLLAAGGLTAGGIALAQDDEKSRFVRFVERQISTPDRRISLGQIDGALSSDVRISEITIADRRGVWLRIENAALVWSRLALLRGRLDIDSLSADGITIVRAPLPAETDEPLDDTPFTLPDLPVEVDIDELNVARVAIAEGVVGPAAELSVEGRARLADGSLDTALTIERLDRPGTLAFTAAFENDSRRLTLDVRLSEPAGGVLANALQVDGRPALALEIAGDGPLSDFTASLTLDSDDTTLLSGSTRLEGVGEGLRFDARLSGDLTPLVASLYDPLVEGGTELNVQGERAGDGAISLERVSFRSGAADLTIAAQIAPDGVPVTLSVDGMLGRQGGAPLALPGGGGAATLGSATIFANLSEAGAIEGRIEIVDLDTNIIAAPAALIEVDGQAENLSVPASRAVRFSVRGGADNVTSGEGAVADALGSRVRLSAEGNWRAGAPLTMDRAALETPTLSADFQGTVQDGVSGRYALRAEDLSAFAGLAGRDLSGSVDLSAIGSIGFDGLFDLMLDGTAGSLTLGLGSADGILAGTTELSGRAARSAEGISFETFALTNEQLEFTANGAVTDTAADLDVALDIRALSALDPRLAGAVNASLSVSGAPARPTVRLSATSAEIGVGERAVTDLSAQFDGTFDRASGIEADLDGALSVTAQYAGDPLQAALDLETVEGARRLSGLQVQVADATASGDLTLRGALLDGELAVRVPEIARVAAIALIDASGFLEADLTFASNDERQDLTANGTARSVSLPGLSLGFASIDLAVGDAFGVPTLNGSAELRALEAGGFRAGTLALRATRDGESSDIALSGDINGASVEAEGALTRLEDGFAATLRSFAVTAQDLAARLVSSARVEVTDTISVDGARLDVGGGEVFVRGQIGDRVDGEVRIDRLPLALANIALPDLGLAGTLNADLRVTGSRAAPTVDAEATATGVTTAQLERAGIAPSNVDLAARFADDLLTIERLDAAIGNGSLTASGTAGDQFALEVNLENLPLAVASAVVPELGLSGSVSGNGTVEGPRAAPDARFSLTARDVSAEATRSFGLPAAQAQVSGTFAGSTLTLERAEVNAGEAQITATGTAGTTLDLSLNARGLPLALANTVLPQLNASGTASAEATITGRASRPQVEFRATSPSFSAVGLGGGTFDVGGSLDGATVRLDRANVALGGGSVSARGTVGRNLDITADIRDLPLALANAFAPDQSLSGRLTGSVQARGRVNAPAATFDIGVDGFSAAPLATAGVGPLGIRADGRFQGNRITLGALRAEGGGLSVTASGTVPLSGGGLNLSVSGTAPLSLANGALAGRGASVDGTARADITVRGSLSRPQVTGAVGATGIVFRDPQTNLVLSDGRLDARLAGERVVIETFSATLGGGTISVSGSVGITGGFPADLSIALREARYTDGRLVAVTLDGDLTVRGPLVVNPVIAGRIDIARAEITVPAGFAGTGPLIDVKHINTPPGVLETLRRARVGPFADDDGQASNRGGGLTLDVEINAPARVFVRGRGIDAELGGSLRVRGPINAVRPVGEFDLIRGRLTILGQRIVFTEGSIVLLGDLNPVIRLVAETRAQSVTVRVIVEGPARDPEIRFESTPELPQDEVLAQLLFGRSLSDLSPFQLAQLAAAAAELAGSGGGPGLLEQIRVFAGLDNLEVVTTETGGTAAQAGRYIADNIYVGVQAGDRSSGVTVNLDVTRDLKVRAEALTDETSIGVYYELEY
ncbi:MAG: translocation/assembly module TamB domain-containing protein [Pseudomonadota bacterium]